MNILDFIKNKKDKKAKLEEEMKLAKQRKARIAEKERSTGKKILEIDYRYRNLRFPMEVQIGQDAYQKLLIITKKTTRSNNHLFDITGVVLYHIIAMNFLAPIQQQVKSKELLEKFLTKNPEPNLLGILQIEFKGSIMPPRTYIIKTQAGGEDRVAVSCEFNYALTIINQNNDDPKCGKVFCRGITSL
jgi:hypothetical protein